LRHVKQLDRPERPDFCFGSLAAASSINAFVLLAMP
jgi:hypothetical protein